MKKALAGLALSLATALPALAGSVYVVVPEPSTQDGGLHSTQVWISNSGTAQHPFFSTFLAVDTDGTQRQGSPSSLAVPVGRTFLLANVGDNLRAGLLEVDASDALSVEARIVNISPQGLQTIGRLPVISSSNLTAAKGSTQLLGLERDVVRGTSTNMGIVNLGKQGAQCEIRLYRSDGTQIASTATVSLKPLSLRMFNDALGLLGEQRITDARAQISCDQPFYPFAAELMQSNGQLMFLAPSATGASTLTRPGSDTGGGGGDGGGGDGGGGGGGTSGSSFVFQQTGTFHVAAVGNPKKQIPVSVPKAMNLKRMIVDLDFTPGPWNREKIPGNHAIAWVYRGKYRGNSVCNVNAFGPNKFTVKMNQNVDMPAGATTSDERSLTFEQGKKYHLHYIYDAENETITAEISSGGTVLQTLHGTGTAENRILTIPSTGVMAEFGHYPGQEGPEIPSYGWAYANLRIEMVPY